MDYDTESAALAVIAGPTSPVAIALASLGANLLKQAKSAEAEPLLRECLAIRAEIPLAPGIATADIDAWVREDTE